MEGTTIELKAVSCCDLALPLSLFGKTPVYAVVSHGDGARRRGRRQQQSTTFDRKGGCNPEWEQQLRFDVAGEGGSSPFLEFDFMARMGVGGVLGDRVIGEARVPIHDLVAEYPAAVGSDGGFRSVSYQVRSHEGKPAGEVSFFYRVNYQNEEIELPSTPPPKLQQLSAGYDAPPPVWPVTSSSSYYPAPPSPPAALVDHLLPPALSAAPPNAMCVLQDPAAMYYYGCPAPPPPPPSDLYGYPAKGYNFAGRDYMESWAPPPPAEPYAVSWKGHDSASGFPGVPWATHGGSMYGSVGHFARY